MTPNRVILIWQQCARAGPLTPDLLSATWRGVGGGHIHQERTERERARAAVQCQVHYDPLKTRATLWRGAIHHLALSNQHVCHCN